jgi:hypothetical protein
MALILADFLVLLHLLFVVFVVAGGFLLLRWPRIAWLQVPAAVWGAYIEISSGICPLTPLENHLRALGGEAGYSVSFVERYLMPILYPANLTVPIQIVLGGLVVAVNLAAYALAYRAWKQRHA